jgi:Rps23 Pro-64 3,4-dihydroxylase Tpa1-like proline 4-hydroxylase
MSFDITTYNDFLNKEDWEYVVNKTINGSQWGFCGHTLSSNYTFWYMPLDSDSFFTQRMFSKIQSLNSNFKLETVYANGQTHSLCGELHPDVQGPAGKYYTFLYYANTEWRPEYGGNTVFSSNDGTKGYSHYPKPNSGILFDSTILHAGLEPTSFYRGLRVTVAFKLELV